MRGVAALIPFNFNLSLVPALLQARRRNTPKCLRIFSARLRSLDGLSFHPFYTGHYPVQHHVIISDANVTAFRQNASRQAQEAETQYLNSDKWRLAKKAADSATVNQNNSADTKAMNEQSREGRRRASIQTTLALQETSSFRDNSQYKDFAWAEH